MQGDLKIKIIKCTNLPIMDKKRKTTDAYIKFYWLIDMYK